MEESLNFNGSLENTSNRASWDGISKEYFVTLLQQNANMHNRYKKGWSKETWEKITNEMKMKFPESSFSTQQLKQLERDLKKNYRIVKGILGQPGFTWNEIGSTVAASNHDWQTLFERDPKARRWRRKIFPYYMSLDALYGGIIPTQVLPQAMSNNVGNDIFQHNSSLFTSNSAPVRLNEEINPSGIPGELNQNHDFRVEDYLKDPEGEDELNSPNFASPPKQDLPVHFQKQNQSDCNFQHLGLAGQNGVGAVPDFSIGLCLEEYERLGSNQADLQHVAEIFKDGQNRESFIALKMDYKRRWLSNHIEMRKKGRFK